MAGRVVTISLIVFAVFSIVIGIFAESLYRIVAPGYSAEQVRVVANLARIMFFAQGIFIVSYVLTSVLESMRRFLVPALAPLLYNLGLILGTVFLAPKFGLTAPAIGVVIGALTHFLIQLPLAVKLGFRFTKKIQPTEGVRDIAKLAAPRLLDLSFQQIVETTVLSFASLISVASYTYFTLANSLQLAPVRLFGTSLAKAALPTLTRETDDMKKFVDTLFRTLYLIFFLVAPVAALFIALRIPTIRIFFGTSIFDWNSTLQTGMVLSAFAVGIPFQAFVALIARAFYAMHDTKTPVIVSVIGDSCVIAGNFIMVRVLNFPAWALALSFSIGALIETIILIMIFKRRVENFSVVKRILPMLKTLFAAGVSGFTMYFLLKFFDKWVPVKMFNKPIAFENLVLDTRYTVNLIILTILVGLLGMLTYIVVSLIMRSEELKIIAGAISKRKFTLIPGRKTEPVTPLDTP